ncbi:hypothetical protein HanIR_Chr09g0434151 [Helianthus annuus]|nr:hypothetical protein HanIR_Chr09g0434151 [Helianthus annuus]
MFNLGPIGMFYVLEFYFLTYLACNVPTRHNISFWTIMNSLKFLLYNQINGCA